MDSPEPDDMPQYTEEEISEELARYRNIVLSACSSLGNLEAVPIKSNDDGMEVDGDATFEKTMNVYVPSKDCLGSLKDIKRYIQVDEQGDDKLVLQWLGEWRILEHDLIPIFIICANKLVPTQKQQQDTEEEGGKEQEEEDRDHIMKITIMCVELFVFLTWNMDSESEEVHAKFIRILRSYKRMFARRDIISSLLAIMVMHMRKSRMSDKERMLVKGILYVFRNILAIPDPLISPTSIGIAQVESQDILIDAMDKEYVIDLFLTLSSSVDEPRFKDLRPILLDIIYFIFYRVPVSALFDQPLNEIVNNSYNNIRDRRIGRHSNFGGVYAVSVDVGTIMPVFNTRDVLNPFANLFKKQTKVQKPKVMEKSSVDREWRIVSPDAIPILRRVAVLFIESCYNIFVSTLFEDIKTSPDSMKAQVPRLFYISAYFVDISLGNPEIDLGCTCALVQAYMFAIVMRYTNDYLDLKEWSSLEPAMYCIQQILLSLSKMHNSTNLFVLSDFVFSNLFYDGDVQDLFTKLCRAYKPTKTTRRFLEQVVQTVETFLVSLKAYCEIKNAIFVRKKARKRSEKAKNNNDDENTNDNIDTNGSTKDADISNINADNNNRNDELVHNNPNNDERTKSSSPEPDTTRYEDGNNSDKSADGLDEDKDNSDAEDSKYVDKLFEYEKYIRAFATREVVKAYSYLFAPPSSIEYAYPMVYRIAVTCERPYHFFKKATMQRLLVLFDDNYSYSRKGEMLDLASWIFRQYITVLNSPALKNQYKAEELGNKLAMECMQTFLRDSGLGKSIDPVITRHTIDLIAEKNKTPNDNSQGEDGEQDRLFTSEGDTNNSTDIDAQNRNATSTMVTNLQNSADPDLDDFDFDDFYNKGEDLFS